MLRTHIFLLNLSSSNFFGHNCYVIPFRSLQVRTWIRQIEKIQALKTNAQSGRRGRQAAHASMEEKLYNECIEMRHQGKPIKRWWFARQAKQILDELELDHNFLFSNHWFESFQNRYSISLRRTTHCSQEPLTALEPAINKFHSSPLRYLISQIWIRRLYHLC